MPRCSALLFLLLVATASAVDAPTIYPLAPTQLGLAVPAGWTAEHGQVGTVLIVRSPLPREATGDAAERERGVISIVVQDVKNEGPLAFFVRCRRDLERTVMGLELDKSEEVLIGGRTWTKQAYQMKVGQFTFRQELFTTVIDSKGICLTCSSQSHSFQRWQNDFVAMVNSLARSRLKLDAK